MNEADERLRDAITDAFTKGSVDARSLSVEVAGGIATIGGTVPSVEQRQRIDRVLAGVPGLTSARCGVTVMPVAPPDSSDGRGRSPLTGTSADSRHESDHQTDP